MKSDMSPSLKPRRGMPTAMLRRRGPETNVSPGSLGDPDTDVGRHNRRLWAEREAEYERMRLEIANDPDLAGSDTVPHRVKAAQADTGSASRYTGRVGNSACRRAIVAYLGRHQPGFKFRTAAAARWLGRSTSQISKWLHRLADERPQVVEKIEGRGMWRVVRANA